MTPQQTVEIEVSSHHPTATTQQLERLFAGPGLAAALFCPNINTLDMPHFQKADQAVHEIARSLQTQNVEAFNEAKQQLIGLLKKHGEPVTQWNPLILELTDAGMLRGAKLAQINLGMTALRSPEGRVSLEGASLQSAIFLCADLSQVTLTDADLSGADCRFADIQETSLQRALLIESDLSHAKLSFSNLDEANLYCAKLNGALIKQASLNEANLRKTDLRNADLYQAILRAARLQNADLREANLFMADLTGAKLRFADLRKAHLGFCCLKEARMPNVRLAGANFTSANLSLTDLQKCRLTGALFSRARFTGAKLSHALLHGVDLSEAIELETAQLQNALFDEETRFPKGFKPRKHALISTRCFRGLKGFMRWLFNSIKLPGLAGRFAH